MSDGPEWFAPKMFGYGAGVPIAWQGWAILLGYVAIVFAAAKLLGGNPFAVAAIVVPATALLLVITAKTTRGGWRWRWGWRRRRDADCRNCAAGPRSKKRPVRPCRGSAAG